MFCSKTAFGILTSSSTFLNRHLRKFLTTSFLLAAAAGASATPALSRISCSSNKYSKPATDACSVYLTSAATSKLRVTLTSNNPAVSVPGSLTVRVGSLTAGFSASVAGVTTAQSALITALAGGVAKTFLISISPSTSTAALAVNATSIGFGAVRENTAASQPLTLTSTGTAPVTVNSVSVSGAGFSVAALTLPATLSPGQSLTLNVQFDPATTGALTGKLTISSNSATTPTSTVSLSGTGSPHQVSLSWSAPSGSKVPVTGYKVYRAPAATGSFTVLDSMDTQTAYTDPGVQSGQTYKYYVTSVDSSGVESSPSNTTTITVP